MVMFIARSAALAGVIAAGVLSESLICEPAHAADYYAFGDTLTSGYAILELEENGTWVAVTTQGIQGWVSSQEFGIGGPGGANTDYTVGFYDGDYFNNYFGFNLAGPVCEVSNPSDCFTLPTNTTITAATLTVYSGTISDNLTYTLYGATRLLSQMEMGSPNASLFEEMMSGTSYGTFALPSGGSVTQLVFTLNSNSYSDIETAIQSKGMFAISGYVDPPTAPEPSTWIMMLAGFAGLGVVARRRAAKRRAAAPAG